MPTCRCPLVWFGWLCPLLCMCSYIYWKRMKACRTGQYCQYRTLLNFWGSVCIILAFLFKTSFINRLKVQLVRASKLYSGKPVHGTFWERGSPVCLHPLHIGSCLWMTLLYFNNSLINNCFWIILIIKIQ